jgi:hypothetical protein
VGETKGPRLYVVPAGSRKGVCSGIHCGAPIYWIKSPNSGRPMPISVDVEGGRVPSERADPRQLDAFSQGKGNVDGRGVSHFTVCPDADRFSRGGGR